MSINFFDKSKRKLSRKEKKKLEKGSTITADVNIWTDDPEPLQYEDTEVRIRESNKNSCILEIRNKVYICNCSINDLRIRKRVVGNSWIGWIAGIILFAMLDIYRFLREFFDVHYTPSLADLVPLTVGALAVVIMSLVLSTRHYDEFNIAWNSLTGVYSALGKKYAVMSEAQTLSEAQILLKQIKNRLTRNTEFAFLTFELEKLIADLSVIPAEELKELEIEAVKDFHSLLTTFEDQVAELIENYPREKIYPIIAEIDESLEKLKKICPDATDLKNTYRGLDDSDAFFESDEEIKDYRSSDEYKREQEEKKKLLEEIEELDLED